MSKVLEAGPPLPEMHCPADVFCEAVFRKWRLVDFALPN